MTKFDFRGARIGTQAIIEQQLGTLQIKSGSVILDDRIDEAEQRVRAIRDELFRLDDRDRGVSVAVEQMTAALCVIEGPSKEPEKVLDHLKTAANALVETSKTVSAASTIIKAITATAAWVASVVS